MGVVAGDFDNDGWDDLYVTCYGPNRLYRNSGDGTFSDVTEKSGVGDPRWSTGAAFADYDGDGWLDLFVANYVDVRLDALPEFGKGKFCEFHGIPVQCGPRGLRGSGDTLYRNKGDGTFEDVSMKAGVADEDGRFGMGVVWSDFNGDGRPDLYVANDTAPNYLYKNNGNGTFVDVALQAGTALSEDGKAQGSMGVAIGDYDHSGGWSIFVTNFSNEYNASTSMRRHFSSPMPPSGRTQRKRTTRSLAGERIFSITTTTAGRTCWSSTDMSTRKWSGPDSLPGMHSANCFTATSRTVPSRR